MIFEAVTEADKMFIQNSGTLAPCHALSGMPVFLDGVGVPF